VIDFLFSQGENTVWFITKFAFIVGILLYVIFAYVVTRQVKLMNETLEVGFEKGMKIISYIHLGVAIAVLLLAVVIL
jgi:hypothetical protein